jgi:hypothetical protein
MAPPHTLASRTRGCSEASHSHGSLLPLRLTCPQRHEAAAASARPRSSAPGRPPSTPAGWRPAGGRVTAPTCSRHERLGGGCDPFSRNLERSKGMGARGSLRTFENLMGVWVRTVQLPPSWCMRDGSTLMPSPDTRRHGTRQGCKAGRSRARLRNPASQVTRGRYTNVLLNRRQNRPAKAG